MIEDTCTDNSDEEPVASSPERGYRSALRRSLCTLGLARDGIALSNPAVSAGFASANAGVDTGFAAAKLATSSSFRIASQFGLMDENSPIKRSVEGAVEAAHVVTSTSLHASKVITQTSLRASDTILSLTGAERGESIRLLAEHVASSHAGPEGQDMKEALLGLASLLSEVWSDGRDDLAVTNANPLEILRGGRSLAVLHERRRADRIATRSLLLRQPTVPRGEELANLDRHMRYAAAAYGGAALKVLGVLPPRPNSFMGDEDVDAIVSLTGVERDDVLAVFGGSELYRPGHFVAVSHADREVVVSIRGTLSMKDVLVDLVCRSEEFESVYDEDVDDVPLVVGRVHGGFLKSARRLASDLHEVVGTALEDNPGYRLVVVGHSLGGGVATLLALLWGRIPALRDRDLRAYSYASPCSVCDTISQAPFTRRHVTSVVYGDDVVSRLSLATFRELQRTAVAFSQRQDATVEELERIRNDLTGDEEKLYCGGRVWWLESKEYNPPHPIVEINPVDELNEIELFPDMFAIHLPKAYLDALEKLRRETQEHPV